jgi:AbrB family looped-hinge helix DNA binding protein
LTCGIAMVELTRGLNYEPKVTIFLYTYGAAMIEVTKGHYIFGTANIGTRGQIVIPKEARDKFGIKPGDSMLIIGEDGKGLAVIKEDLIKDYLRLIIDKDDLVSADQTTDKSSKPKEESD